MHKFRWLMLAGSLLVTPVSCAGTLSLWHFYQQARTGDMRYAQSQATYQAAKTIGTSAFSAFLPKITLTANTTYNNVNNRFLGNLPGTSFSFPSGTFRYNSNGYEFMVTQALFDLRALAGYRAADSKVEAARYTAQLAHTELILAVARAYFSLLLAKSELHLAHAEQRALEIQMQSAQQRFHLGTASITDINEARARYDVVTAQALKAANAVRDARNRMVRMTNQSARHLWPLDLTRLPQPPQPLTLSSDLRRAYRGNLTLDIARADARAARAAARAAGDAGYPTLHAVATYGYEHAHNSDFGFGNITHEKTIGIDLSFPIYQGGELAAAAAKARAEARKAVYGLERARRLVRYNVRQGFLNVRSDYARIRALQTAERASQTALASDKLGERIGIRSNVDVLQAQQQLYSAKRSLAAAVYSYLINRLQLSAAIRPLAAADVRRLNGRLRPPRGGAGPTRTIATPH